MDHSRYLLACCFAFNHIRVVVPLGAGSSRSWNSQTRFVCFSISSLKAKDKTNENLLVNTDPLGKSPFQFSISLKSTAIIPRVPASPQAQSCHRAEMQISEIQTHWDVSGHRTETQSDMASPQGTVCKMKWDGRKKKQYPPLNEGWGAGGDSSHLWEFQRWLPAAENLQQQEWLLQEGWRLGTTGCENICDWHSGASHAAKERTKTDSACACLFFSPLPGFW